MRIRFRWNGKTYIMPEDDVMEFLRKKTGRFAYFHFYKDAGEIDWLIEGGLDISWYKCKEIRQDLVMIKDDLVNLYKKTIEGKIEELKKELEEVIR